MIGYACINMALREQEIFTNRTMRKATLEREGPSYLSSIIQQNLEDLLFILKSNEENDLRFVNIIGNSEVIHFVRDEDQSLIGIEKTSCSEIHFVLRDAKIESSKFINQPDGQTYPPSQLPENARTLRGFLWRESEKPLTKNDIFIKDEE